MRRAPVISLAVLAFAASWPAGAQTLECPGQTQTELNVCAAQALEQADAELNAVYREVMRRLAADAGLRDAVRSAQRAWLTFRDRACEAEAIPYRGGTIAPLMASECLRRLTTRRTDDLKQFTER